MNCFILPFENQQIGICFLGQEWLFSVVNKINTPFDVILDNDSWFLGFVLFFVIEQAIHFFHPNDTVDYDFFVWDFFFCCFLNLWQILRLKIDLEIGRVDDGVFGLLELICSCIIGVNGVF